MYRIAICDDEKEIGIMVSEKVNEYKNRKSLPIYVTIYTDSYEIMKTIEERNYFDVYILDIEMPLYSGLDIVKELKNRCVVCQILFLTAHNKYAVEACGQVTGYIPKNMMNKIFDVMMNRVFKILNDTKIRSVYIIETKKSYMKIFQDDILYIYKNKKYSYIVLNNGECLKERCGIKELYKKLDKSIMFFLNRGIIINVIHIKNITPKFIETVDGYKITVTSLRAIELKKQVSEYWSKIL